MTEIKYEHIREAEILLIDGNQFEEKERVPFIKELSSIDLLAVPGSGKTTALQAKLYCLSKHLPFEDGAGILVLSHTNAAIEEIEKNLKSHCPKLFKYPNFVGTVQSFVNKFLANNGCYFKYGSYITYNNNDIYENEAENYYKSLQWKNSEPKGLKNKLFGRLNIGKEQLRYEEKIENIRTFIKYFELDIHKRKILYNNASFYTYSGNSQQYYLELEQWKEGLFRKGILNYKDSFYLGEWYINECGRIVNLLQKRFKYVFIDEMQDLEKFQIDIIDSIFFKKDSPTIIQRIGDINQAIYNGGKKVKVEADWQPREKIYYLTGSNRLTQEIADVVNFFTLNPQKDEKGEIRFVVNGLKQLKHVIRPHLIIYDENTKDVLEDKFKELIKGFSLQETFEGKKYGFKIIGWNARWGDENENHNGKLRLEDIFKHYNKDVNEKKESLDSLSKYLQCFDKNKKTLKFVQDNILNSFLTVLKHEKKTYFTSRKGVSIERYYTQRELIQCIKSDSDNYSYFKTKLYKWCFSLITKKNYSEVYCSVKSFIENEFKDWFGLSLTQRSIAFLGEKYEEIIINTSELPPHSSQDEIKIDIGTVHSAKGQTHCATMYVETSFHKYETEKLKVTVGKGRREKVLNNPLYKQEHGYRLNQDSHAKMTMKMIYVGFSRPTHLLCFACLRENVENDIDLFRNAGWEIVDLQTNNEDRI
ncbi:MAG: UvrD-helicase domain-containing protein [Bacteroidales bacterium]|nr:UvrD-helicase domain-containing protein [Bacteroidales bacterium]